MGSSSKPVEEVTLVTQDQTNQDKMAAIVPGFTLRDFVEYVVEMIGNNSNELKKATAIQYNAILISEVANTALLYRHPRLEKKDIGIKKALVDLRKFRELNLLDEESSVAWRKVATHLNISIH